jgi:hypothetical protein
VDEKTKMKLDEYAKQTPKHGAFYGFHHLWTQCAYTDPAYDKAQWQAVEKMLLHAGLGPEP